MTHSNFTVCIVLGKSGSGKGTQVEKLANEHCLKIISSGSLLRARAEQQDFVGKRIAGILAKGGLIPTPIIFHLWLHELEQAREDEKFRGIIFEGSPRKLYEAWMIEETLRFYGLEKNVHALYINISDQEALRRLLSRAREDDTESAIQSRLQWFKEEVMPAVEFYRERDQLLELNGEQPIEDVTEEIAEKTKDFFTQ